MAISEARETAPPGRGRPGSLMLIVDSLERIAGCSLFDDY